MNLALLDKWTWLQHALSFALFLLSFQLISRPQSHAKIMRLSTVPFKNPSSSISNFGQRSKFKSFAWQAVFHLTRTLSIIHGKGILTNDSGNQWFHLNMNQTTRLFIGANLNRVKSHWWLHTPQIAVLSCQTSRLQTSRFSDFIEIYENKHKDISWPWKNWTSKYA